MIGIGVFKEYLEGQSGSDVSIMVRDKIGVR